MSYTKKDLRSFCIILIRKQRIARQVYHAIHGPTGMHLDVLSNWLFLGHILKNDFPKSVEHTLDKLNEFIRDTKVLLWEFDSYLAELLVKKIEQNDYIIGNDFSGDMNMDIDKINEFIERMFSMLDSNTDITEWSKRVSEKMSRAYLFSVKNYMNGEDGYQIQCMLWQVFFESDISPFLGYEGKYRAKPNGQDFEEADTEYVSQYMNEREYEDDEMDEMDDEFDEDDYEDEDDNRGFYDFENENEDDDFPLV